MIMRSFPVFALISAAVLNGVSAHEPGELTDVRWNTHVELAASNMDGGISYMFDLDHPEGQPPTPDQEENPPDDEMCSDFLAMCADDPVCQSCFDGKDQGALENCILDQNLRDGCDAIVFGACCIDEQSSQDCLGSDIFKSLVLCEAKRDLNKDCGPLICPTELAEDICLASLEDQYAVCQGDPVCSECVMGWDVEDHVDCIDGRWFLEPCTFGELEACCIDQLVPSLDCMANDAFQTLYRCREKEPVGLEYCSGPWTCSASGGTDSTPAPTPPPAVSMCKGDRDVCKDDVECSECLDANFASSSAASAFNHCVEEYYDPNGDTTDLSTKDACWRMGVNLCCRDELTNRDCEANQLFQDLHLCWAVNDYDAECAPWSCEDYS